MTSGVYERTPEMSAAMSKAKIGVSLLPEHCAAISAGKTGVPQTPKQIAANSKAHTGVSHSPEHIAAMRESDAVKSHAETMRGGNDICDHHYIYDHSDLSKYTVQMTRSDHQKLHWALRKLGYKVPHINVTK